MTRAELKETLRNIMNEESEYQVFFKNALEKAGKSITDMSDEEKKEFFNKIDAAWDGEGEKNEGNAFGAAVVAAKKAGEDEFEVGGKTYKVEESVNEEEIKWNAVQNAIINFLKTNTKILDKRVQAKDTNGVKGGLKSIISGLVNAQRNLKLQSVNEIKKGSIVMPYAMDKHGEFIVDKVFKNKDGETSYIGKFKKSCETREFILHSKDKIVKESVNEAGIPKMYTKYRAVIKKIKELEDTQQKLAKTYFDARSKGDVATEKSQLELMKKNQKQLNAYRKNLTSIESDYINNMDYFPGE